VHKKTLFQRLAEKCLAASQAYKKTLPLAIMTSPENHQETVAYFKDQDSFGLGPDQLFFFTQTDLPFEDEMGRPLPLRAAAGNGDVFKQFKESGLLDTWRQKGIKAVNLIAIDNPLADPFDANLLGHHLATGADASFKCIERIDGNEKVGVLIPESTSWKVKEYSELTPEEKDPTLYPLANLSLFCLSLPFMDQLASTPFPYHFAKKRLYSGEEAPWGIKKETFLFDLLPYAKNAQPILYPREITFAPIKNKEGADTPESARRLVYQFESELYKKGEHKEAPPYPFEVPASYYYML
jgi:UDP-N-acetylglucosamine/UDP-N-acetylgalactosamine diphosphorylase